MGTDNSRYPDRPGNRQSRIIPANAAPRSRLERRRYGIEHFAIVFQRLEAMGEALGDVELPVVLCRQFDAIPLAKAGRALTDIDDDVENGALRYADQLIFLMGRRLEVCSWGGQFVVPIPTLEFVP